MDIAQSKRKENIAEYILYLWQLEDLLRAMQFSPEAIYSQLVAPRKIDESIKHEFLIWYMDIVNLLRKEDKEESGHLEHTLHLIGDMHNLHLQLMQHPIGAQRFDQKGGYLRHRIMLQSLVCSDVVPHQGRNKTRRGNQGYDGTCLARHSRTCSHVWQSRERRGGSL